MHEPHTLRVVARETIHEGHSYNYEQLTVAYPDGVERTKPMVRHNGAACIIPVLESADGPQIVMVRNERVTIEASLLEIPAGGIDGGEEPIVAAGRELVEETGYEAATIEPLCRFYTTPGMTDELMHVFIARGLTFVGQQLEVYESLTVHRFPVAELLGMIDRGELVDGKSVLAILQAQRRGMFKG